MNLKVKPKIFFYSVSKVAFVY